MNSASLFEVLSAIHPLSENFKQALEKEIIGLSLPKNHLLLEAPAIASYAYILTNGFAMSYTYINGKKKVEGFWRPSEIIVPFKSFLAQSPSTDFIQLISPGDVFYIRHDSVIRLLDNFPEGNYIYCKTLYTYYENCRIRLQQLQRLSATERYLKLHQEFSGIEQLVSQEDIASYLGIAPQSLSRIKRKLDNS